MADVAITKATTVRLTNLTAPARSGTGYVFKSTWKVPSALKSGQRNDRAEGIQVCFHIVTKTPSKTKIVFDSPTSKGRAATETKHILVFRKLSRDATSASFNLDGFKDDKGKSYTRKSFYPYTSVKIAQIYIDAAATNRFGFTNPATASRKIAAPPEPRVSAVTVGPNGDISCTFTPAGREGYCERRSTEYQVQMRKMTSGRWGNWATKAQKVTESNSAFSKSYDLTDWQTAGVRYQMRCRARSIGMGGVSGWTEWKSHVTGFPKKATLGKASVPTKAAANARGTLSIKTNSSAIYPVDGVRLEMLANTTISTAAEAKLSDAWSATGLPTDDGACTSLTFPIGAATPDAGKHTWLRVVSWHDIEATFYTESEPMEVKALYVPTADTSSVAVGTVTSGDDGTSLVVPVTWPAAQAVSPTEGTIIAWSKRKDAWSSNDQPDMFQVPDKGIGGTHNGSLTFNITGLDEGETYYVRAVRYEETENGTDYGKWSAWKSGVPSLPPTDVVLDAPAGVAEGDDAAFSWAYGGGGAQRSWRLVTTDNRVVAKGSGPVQSCTVPSSKLMKLATTVGSTHSVATVKVAVSTGGGSSESATVDVRISRAPVLAIEEITPTAAVEGGLPELTAQPIGIELSCTLPCDVAIALRASDVSGDPAIGLDDVPAGDTVWSDVLSPAWEYDQANDIWTAAVSPGVGDAETDDQEALTRTPARLPLLDCGEYELSVMAFDRDTGLSSEPATASFAVAWARQAPDPAAPTVAASASAGDDGMMRRKASITLAQATGWAEGDSYDIYRLTGDRAEQIYSGALPGMTVTDEYAPFGEAGLAYRICLVTSDGDWKWADFPYSLEGGILRLDWNGRYVELPWNLEISDSWAKQFEGTVMMDGTKAGSWGAGVSRTGSYSTDMIRITEEDSISKVRELANWNGPVFVRTLLGTAFCANVQVDSMDMSALGGMGMAVSLGITEVAMPPEFAATLDDPEEDGGEEEEGE